MRKALINNILTYSILSFGVLGIHSCKTQKSMEDASIEANDEADDVEEVVFDTMVIDGFDPQFAEENEAPEAPYRASAKRTFDLLHTKLDVSFDWEKEHLIGKADLTLVPLFYDQTELELDAKGFEIKTVSLQKTELKYQYDGEKLTVELGKAYTRKDTFNISISYIAKPNEGPVGGSAAITSDKGLYFINASGTNPLLPQQIWTQGETESSSRWFPTIDKPNERCTQEISITVADKFTTLSNGTRISSVKKDGGLRTDTWKLDKPHAPYLFMMAIGEYAWVEDKWRNIPLYYIVEPEFEPYAKKIYNHTPEMLEYFSTILDYPYPWDKFAQITAREYVSGAMENTTAVLFGDFIQKTDIELIDDDNDGIVAHEMFHHWFGDLVTCESWSNLTLNEGFANYAEYLWLEHKYGRDKADLHRLNEMQAYVNDAQQGNVHPLIHFHYNDKEDMFDSHSYNKGGLVLHMLRTYVGDAAFFAALNHYLKKNAYTAVEVDELRMAFEDVTGEDLNWFFNQWYLREGHPQIDVEYVYNPEQQSLSVFTTQNQSVGYFKIPFEMAIYNADGSVRMEKVWIENQHDTITIADVKNAPINISLDGKDDILAEINEQKSNEYLFNELMYSPNPGQRMNAIYVLASSEETDYNRLASVALRDEVYLIQQVGIEVIPEVENFVEKLKSLALYGGHKDLRAAAIVRLAESGEDIVPVFEQIFKTEKTPTVLSTALSVLTELDFEKASMYAKQLEVVNSDQILGGLGVVYSRSEDPATGKWYMDKIETKSIYATYQLFGPFVEYLNGLPTAEIEPYADALYKIGVDMKRINFLRFMSVASLSALANGLQDNTTDANAVSLATKIKDYISKAKEVETDPLLLSRYAEF